MSLRLNRNGNIFKMYRFSVITIKANKENSNNPIVSLKETEAKEAKTEHSKCKTQINIIEINLNNSNHNKYKLS